MIRFDTSHAPLVVVRWTGDITERQIDRYIKAHEGLLEGEVEHALLVDVTGASFVGSVRAHLIELSQWLDRRAGVLTRNCLACAFVVGDEGLREAVDTLCEVQPLDLPSRIFGRPTAAVEWLRPIFEPRSEEPPTESSLGQESSSPEPVQEPEGTGPPFEEPEGGGWSPYGHAGQG